MTTFSGAGSTIGINMGNIPYFYGTVTYASSGRITVSSGSEKQDYYGYFRFAADGSVDGTLNSTYYTSSSSGLKYSLTEFSADARTAYSYINAGQPNELATKLLSGRDYVYGTIYNDALYGYNGNDFLSAGSGNDTLDGGAGIDTVGFNTAKGNISLTKNGNSYVSTDRTGLHGTDTLLNVERISFTDKSVALDIDGSAGQAYRLYQAAFNRAPDLAGLGGWISSLDGGLRLVDAAAAFYGSVEFKSLYGVSPTTEAFVTLLYQNVLHRAPDPAGFADWVGLLKSGAQSTASVLVGFSESAENQLNVIGSIQNGIDYIPYG